ncbi:hypothetical protein G3480_17085 [Thiorhodococcus mannitoliphagus]|uniref:Uncharacterized protein n=1 Tax=Thiorhodococcus mannitoliphagus TaxID=329406 RepID=A0A6P1DV68_9GAMM|nr:hypothetical protein [Thiorhodococcus mannitoliphagus]NEX21998.1 hypothetical protein [Thiorhodococcus mannitoliphagus]
MLDPEMSDGEEGGEPIPQLVGQEIRGQLDSLDVRRRIEHIRELRRLRELLEDPDFDELG